MPDDKTVIRDISPEQAEEVVERLPDLLEQVKSGEAPSLPGFDAPQREQEAPAQLLELLRNIETEAPCGGAMMIQWESGPWKGLPLRVYCDEPLRLTDPEKRCTGPRFVPSFKQFTKVDAEDPMHRERQVSVPEIMAGIDLAAKKAAAITGVRDNRSEKERARHVGINWAKQKEAARSKGGWGL